LWAGREERCVLAAGEKRAPLAVPASASIRPTRQLTAVLLAAAVANPCSPASTDRVARPHFARPVHRPAVRPVRALLSQPLCQVCVERQAHWGSASDRTRRDDGRQAVPSARRPGPTGPPVGGGPDPPPNPTCRH